MKSSKTAPPAPSSINTKLPLPTLLLLSTILLLPQLLLPQTCPTPWTMQMLTRTLTPPTPLTWSHLKCPELDRRPLLLPVASSRTWN